MSDLDCSAHDSTDDWIPPATSRAGLWIALTLVVAAIGGGVWWLMGPPSVAPERVLIAVETLTSDGGRGAWWGPRGTASARIADTLGKTLGDVGVDCVPPGAPETLKAMANAQTQAEVTAVARQFGAAAVVVGTARVIAARPLFGGDGAIDCVIEATISVRSTETGGVNRPTQDPPTRLYTYGDDEQECLTKVAERLANLEAAWIAKEMTALSPELQRLGAGDGLSVTDMARAKTFDGIFRFGRRVEGAKEEHGIDLGRLTEWLALEHEPIGAIDGETYMIGTREGGGVVLMDQPRRFGVVADAAGYLLRKGDERLIERMPDGTDRTIVEVYNFFSHPVLSPDGQTVIAVLDERQFSKSLVLIDVKTGELTPLLTEKERYISSPIWSVDGQWISVWLRDCRRCKSRLAVLPATGGTPKVVWPADEDSESILSMPVWGADGRTLYITAGEERGGATLWAVDRETLERRPLLGPDAPLPTEGAAKQPTDEGDAADNPTENAGTADHHFSGFFGPARSPDGSIIYLKEYTEDGMYIGRFIVKTAAYERLWQGRAERLKPSPDGRQLAFQSPDIQGGDDTGERDSEIGILALPALGTAHPEEATLRVLTANYRDDDLTEWAQDSSAVFAQNSSRDGIRETKRWTVRVFRLAVDAPVQ